MISPKTFAANVKCQAELLRIVDFTSKEVRNIHIALAEAIKFNKIYQNTSIELRPTLKSTFFKPHCRALNGLLNLIERRLATSAILADHILEKITGEQITIKNELADLQREFKNILPQKEIEYGWFLKFASRTLHLFGKTEKYDRFDKRYVAHQDSINQTFRHEFPIWPFLGKLSLYDFIDLWAEGIIPVGISLTNNLYYDGVDRPQSAYELLAHDLSNHLLTPEKAHYAKALRKHIENYPREQWEEMVYFWFSEEHETTLNLHERTFGSKHHFDLGQEMPTHWRTMDVQSKDKAFSDASRRYMELRQRILFVK